MHISHSCDLKKQNTKQTRSALNIITQTTCKHKTPACQTSESRLFGRFFSLYRTTIVPAGTILSPVKLKPEPRATCCCGCWRREAHRQMGSLCMQQRCKEGFLHNILPWKRAKIKNLINSSESSFLGSTLFWLNRECLHVQNKCKPFFLMSTIDSENLCRPPFPNSETDPELIRGTDEYDSIDVFISIFP